MLLRPSRFGSATQPSVYDVTGGTTTVGGIVSVTIQVRMQRSAGQQLPMVMAGNGDVLDTTLAAGKTYYVLVKPRMGLWKARSSP